MATGGQSSSPPPQDPVTSLTDCPCCRSLCLGASILPCGHVLCRGCLHDALQDPTADCLQCQQPLRLPRDQSLTPSQLIQQMATDFVVEHLVLQELERQTDIPCLICPNRMAANVCLNCHEYYCETCSAHHQKSRATKGHALRLLPQAARNTSFPDSTPPPLTSSSDLSTLSMDSIRNISDQQSRDASRDSSRAVKGRRKKENGLSQRDYSDHQDIETALETIMSLAKQLLDSVREHKQVLGTYVHHVTRSDVIQGTDPGSYVIRIRDPDVSMDMKTDSFERRMNVIRKDHHCPGLDKLKMIMDQLSQLLPSPVGGKIPSSSFMNPEKSTTASSSSSSSSPQTSTATPQTPPTQDDTPSFTPRVDWMNATPQRVFTSSVKTAGDRLTPWITSIVCLPDDRLVMIDWDNNKVKVMDVKPPHTVSASPHLPERPWSLAVLPDGLVAMTTWHPLIYLMKVTNTVTVASRIQTVRQYDGIAGHSEGLLIVSCEQSFKGPGAVDVVTRQGQLVRTLTDSSVVLKSPRHLCPSGDQHILLSDIHLDVVHKVDVCSGQVSQTFQHTDMKFPRQVCADSDGNMFVACGGDTECVMVRNRDGQWKQLLTASQHSDHRKDWPCGLCLTRSGHLVVSWLGYGCDTVVICYKFT